MPRCRLGVAQAAEQAEHPAGADRGEEILQIETQHHLFARVPPRAVAAAAAAHEAEGVAMRWHLVQDPAQHLPLQRFQRGLRRLDQPQPAAGLAVQHTAVVVDREIAVPFVPRRPVRQVVQPARR
nr:hypothetical protein [Halovulum marinum]